jgi:signal transduction histidine kinase
MNLAALAQHLRDTREAFIARWKAVVCSDTEHVPSAQRLTEPELRDHLPQLLERIAHAIEGGATPEVDAEGREHGHNRRRNGYSIAEVLCEHSILRQILMDDIDGYAEGKPGLTREAHMEARRRLLDVIDWSGQAAAAQFHAEAIAELQEKDAALQAADRQKDRFLSILSHELRSPLSSILMAVQMLDFVGSDDPRLAKSREVIERQVHHQVRLIEDLLDVNRIAQGKFTLHRAVMDLKTAVSHAVEACMPAIKGKGQEMNVALPDEPLSVDADPVRMEQVVTNLLTNANRYTDTGGEISLSAAKEDGAAVVRVRDTGIGISPEMLPRVFNLFAQADTSLERIEGGLGIGLTLVKSLVELHGGSVEVRSDGLGMGSEFSFRLPLISAVAEAAAPEPASGGATQPVRRIAVIEDNADSRAVLAELLEVLGHEVVTAADGPEALRLAAEKPPEVWIVDIGLPGMDGYEVARALRRLVTGQRLLLIALTGYGSPAEQEQTRAAGFDAHLTKPASIEDLQRLLT